jgi:hypothetical protein
MVRPLAFEPAILSARTHHFVSKGFVAERLQDLLVLRNVRSGDSVDRLYAI